MILIGAAVILALLTACNGNKIEPVPVSEQLSEIVSASETVSEETVSEIVTSEAESVKAENTLADGLYYAEFNTDSTMFHANETCDGKGLLTVKDGEMTIHVSLPSKTIQNLYSGLAEDAQKEGAELLQPTMTDSSSVMKLKYSTRICLTAAFSDAVCHIVTTISRESDSIS